MIQYIKAKIIKLETITEYMDIVYEQNVVIKIKNGIEFGVFNGGKGLTKEKLDKIVNILLVIPIFTIKKIDHTQPIIIPAHTNPEYYKNHVFEGMIIKKGIKDKWHIRSPSSNLVVVNVGVGDILLDVDDINYNEINEGDFLKITALRTDLLDFR